MHFLLRSLLLVAAFAPPQVAPAVSTSPHRHPSAGAPIRIDAAAAVTSVERRFPDAGQRAETNGRPLAAGPAAVTPTTAVQYPVSDPVLLPNADAQEAPAVASNGTEYLVVWQDGRRDGDGSPSIYGARVDLTGAVLDPTGFVISTAPHGQESPSVAWTGRDFLVAWSDARNATSGDRSSGFVERDIYAARVTPAGTILDPAGVAIARGAPQRITPAIAFDGADALVVWAQKNPGTNWDVDAVRVSTTGHLLVRGRPFAVSSVPGNQFAPALSFGGATTARPPGRTPPGRFLVAWQDARSGVADIYTAVVTAAGVVLAPGGTRVPTFVGPQLVPSVAWNPKQPGWLVVWTEAASGVNAVYGARIALNGTVLDRDDGFPIAEYDDDSEAAGVHVTTAGAYAVVYARATEIDEVYVSSLGAVANATRRTLVLLGARAGLGGAALATAGARALVVWSHFSSSSSYDVFAEPLSERIFGVSATAGATVVSKAADPQSAPALAWNGTEYLVAWVRPPGSVYAARLSASGTVLDGTGIEVTASAEPHEPISVSSDGRDFLVTWTDTRFGATGPRIDAARISAGGTNLDPAGIGISGPAGYASASASDGTGYLVAWSSFQSAANGADVYGARVEADGTLPDRSAIPLSTAAGDELWPRLAWSGTEFLAVWQDHRSGLNIYGTRVQKDGTVLDADGIPIATEPPNQQTPDVASDGKTFLVAWEETASYDAFDVAARRVGNDGAVLDKPATTIAAAVEGGRPAPAVAWTGDEFLVGWRNPSAGAIAATKLDSAGTIVGSAPAQAPIDRGSEIRPLSATGATARAALAYAHRADEPRYGSVSRVFVRFVQ